MTVSIMIHSSEPRRFRQLFLRHSYALIFGCIVSSAAIAADTSTEDIDSVKQQLQQLLSIEDAPLGLRSKINEATALISAGSFHEADAFLSQAIKEYPDQPELLIRHAEVLATLNNNSFAGKPYELIGQALDQNRRHKQALWMMALANKQLGNPQASYVLLNLLHLEILSAESETGATKSAEQSSTAADSGPVGARQVVENMLEETAKQLESLGLEIPVRRVEKPKSDITAADTKQQNFDPSIAVYITLDPQIVKDFSPSDSVYVYARPTDGSRMPLAVTRRLVKEFPATITLDKSMAMMPSRDLSSVEMVTVGARASKSGTAMPFAGDWEREIKDIPVSTREVIAINVDFELK